MHFGVAQRFAALIAGVRQMSLKLSAKAAAGLPRRVKGIRICGAGWSRNVGGGRAMYRAPRVHLLSESWRASRRLQLCGAGWSRNVGGFVLCTARRAFICFRGTGAHRGACVLRPRAACSFAFGELAHIKALAFCVQAARVSIIWAVANDCMTKCRDYEFRVLDPSALFAKKSQKNC